MSRSTKLEVVGPNSPRRSAKKKRLTIVQAVKSGDRVAELEATHLRIAAAVEDESTPARDLASLTKRQLEISKEIESLRKQQKEAAKDGAISEDEDWSEEAI